LQAINEGKLQMLTNAASGQSAGDSQRNARGSAITGIVALAVIVSPVLLQFPEEHLKRIAYWPLKTLEITGMLPVTGIVVLVVSLGALVLGYLGNPRIHRLAVVGLVSGAAAFMLLVITVMFSYILGHLWLVGFGFTPAG
jgi:hypothetical protein